MAYTCLHINSLHEMLFHVLINLSPYVQRLSQNTVLKYSALLKKCLQHSAGKERLIEWLLEVVNFILQYQIHGNTDLVYSIGTPSFQSSQSPWQTALTLLSNPPMEKCI